MTPDGSVLGGGVMSALVILGLVLYFLLAERWIAQSMQVSTHDPAVGMRRLGMIRALIKLAPLLGLLGTVCGMTQTFHAMAIQSDTLQMAAGIHAALYTTQFGLAIAIPAFLLEKGLRDPMLGLHHHHLPCISDNTEKSQCGDA